MKLTAPIIATAFAALAALSATQASADILNPGFESDLTNWTASPGANVSVVTSATDVNGSFGTTYLPTQGLDFAKLTAGAANTYTTLSQTFTLAGNARVTGDVAFVGFDFSDADLGNNDNGYVKLIRAGGGTVTAFYSDINTVGSLGETPWTSFSAIVGPGTYTLQFGVENANDNILSSLILADNISVAAVPEPSTWALLLLGFAGVGFASYRRTRKGAASLVTA